MIINSYLRNYEVIIENSFDFVRELCKIENNVVIVDKNVYLLYKNQLNYFDNIMIVEAIESNKNIEKAIEICEKITNLPTKRNTTLISIGGGIIQDITGFVSSIMYRGINWIYVPTTLLSACDSCIGGKTSLNYNKYKNLFGTFYVPNKIYINPAFFSTLSKKDFYSGLGEIVKFAVMRGESQINKLSNEIELLMERNNRVLLNYINDSLEYKKVFIEKDEFDRNERVKLNFAHTFGHAIESITNYEIPHGTAVAIGTIMANYISLNRGLISRNFEEESKSILLKIINIDSNLLNWDKESFVNIMKKDKKQIDNRIRLVLLSKENNVFIANDVDVEEISKAIDYFISLYKRKNEN